MAYMKKATPRKMQKTATPITEKKAMNKVSKPLTKTATPRSSGTMGKSKIARKKYI